MMQDSNRGRIPELDGIRGIAIVSVLCFHYIAIVGLNSPGSIPDRLQRLVILGGTGVDLFFVLSGFLIGGILLDARESPNFFRTFYLRRFFRIIPVYYAWIAAYVAVVVLGGRHLQALTHSGEMPQVNWDVYRHFLFLQNFTVGRFHGMAGAWFDPAWSLAIEEQFYLLAPVAVWLLSKRGLKIFLWSVVVLVPVLRVVLLKSFSADPGLVAQSMPARADVLAIGILAAMFWREPGAREWLARNTRVSYGALGVLFFGVAAVWKWAPHYRAFEMQAAGYSVIAAFYVTLLLVTLTIPEGPIAKIARARWLRELGMVSYAMYLIHVLVDVACHAVLLRSRPQISTVAGTAVTILAVLVTYGIAKLSWVFLESPLLRRGHAFKYWTSGNTAVSEGGS